MRRERYAIAGGVDGLRLNSEGEHDQRLTAVERAILEQGLRARGCSDSQAQLFLASCSVRCRELNGYGGYVYFAMCPECGGPDQPNRARPAGEALILASWRRRQMGAVIGARPGALESIELYPIDGENWTPDEVERLIFANLDDVVVSAWEDL